MDDEFRIFLDKMRAEGFVITINEEIDKEFEIARFLEDHDGEKIVEFLNIKDSKYPLLGTLFPPNG